MPATLVVGFKNNSNCDLLKLELRIGDKKGEFLLIKNFAFVCF